MNDLVEKPYAFVPFVQDEPQRHQLPGGHARYDENLLTGALRFAAHVKTPVQVASGYQELFQGPSGYELLLEDSRIQRSGQRVHLVPGSSWKGAVRAVVEAISPSCIGVRSPQTLRYLPGHLARCTRLDELCPACRIFGLAGGKRRSLQGRIAFDDAVVREERRKIVIVSTPLLWQPARRSRGLPAVYLDRGQAKGRKFYYHARRAKGPDRRVAFGTGAVLDGCLHFVNLTEGELGLVLAAMGLKNDSRFPIKVGAGKPVGMGTVLIQPDSLELVWGLERSGRLGQAKQVFHGEDLESKVNSLIEKAQAEGLLLRPQLEELARIYAERGLTERQAPEGVY